MHSTAIPTIAIVLSYVGTFIAGAAAGFFGLAKWLNKIYD